MSVGNLSTDFFESHRKSLFRALQVGGLWKHEFAYLLNLLKY